MAVLVDREQREQREQQEQREHERYGLGAWEGPGDRWRLDGHLGQYVVVDDARRAVVTITASEEHRDGRFL